MAKLKLISILLILVINSVFLRADTKTKIIDALDHHYKRSDITVKTIFDGNTLKKLLIRINNPSIGPITADYVTIAYDYPKLDWKRLLKKRFKVKSHSGFSVSVLVSETGIKNYFYSKARQYKKKGFEISVDFKPPYVECKYNMPADQLSSESAAILSKYIPGNSFNGYAVFNLSVRNNALSASSQKVILNHFLLPNVILSKLQNRYNPFDSVRPIAPFNYKLNKLKVQSKYILFSN